MSRHPGEPIVAARTRVVAAGVIGALGVVLGAVASAAAEEPALPVRVDILFVLDNSGSMRRHDPGRATDRVVTGFAAGLPRGGRLGVVLFDESARLVEPLTREVGPGTGPHWSDVMRRLDYAGQWTNTPAGIERALYELKHAGREGARQVVVLVTDGIVDTGDPARDLEKTRWLKDELVAEARRAGVRVFGVALTSDADVELIQALALGTGGDYWRVERAEQIDPLLARVGELVRVPSAGAAVASSAPYAPPPVSAAPGDRDRGVWLLSVGLGVAAALLFQPLAAHWRRRARRRAPTWASALGDDPFPLVALPALPREGRPPVVKLLDPDGATGRGDAVLLLEKPSTRIGRDPGSEVAIASPTVSSLHATIEWRDGYFQLEDQRSTNGTTLNGTRLAAQRPRRLKSGDRIGIAGHELRFLIPGHEPNGGTAVLGRTSVPGVASTDATVPPGEPGAVPHPVAGLVDAFDRCLAAHLERIEALGERHRRFVERAFAIEARGLLSRRGQRLIERSRAEGQGAQDDFARAGIHYTLCVVPGSVEGGRRWYTDRAGGYAKFLVGLLDGRSSAGDAFDAVCVITFGACDEPWISVTIVPARDDADAIEVMSLEFLSDDERREALALDIVDVGGRA